MCVGGGWAADGGGGKFCGGELIQLPGGEAGEAVVHADVIEAELGARAFWGIRVGPVVAPENLNVFLSQGGGGQKDGGHGLRMAFRFIAQVFDGRVVSVEHIHKVAGCADAILQADGVDAGIGQNGAAHPGDGGVGDAAGVEGDERAAEVTAAAGVDEGYAVFAETVYARAFDAVVGIGIVIFRVAQVANGQVVGVDERGGELRVIFRALQENHVGRISAVRFLRAPLGEGVGGVGERVRFGIDEDIKTAADWRIVAIVGGEGDRGASAFEGCDGECCACATDLRDGGIRHLRVIGQGVHVGVGEYVCDVVFGGFVARHEGLVGDGGDDLRRQVEAIEGDAFDGPVVEAVVSGGAARALGEFNPNAEVGIVVGFGDCAEVQCIDEGGSIHRIDGGEGGVIGAVQRVGHIFFARAFAGAAGFEADDNVIEANRGAGDVQGRADRVVDAQMRAGFIVETCVFSGEILAGAGQNFGGGTQVHLDVCAGLEGVGGCQQGGGVIKVPVVDEGGFLEFAFFIHGLEQGGAVESDGDGGFIAVEDGFCRAGGRGDLEVVHEHIGFGAISSVGVARLEAPNGGITLAD